MDIDVEALLDQSQRKKEQRGDDYRYDPSGSTRFHGRSRDRSRSPRSSRRHRSRSRDRYYDARRRRSSERDPRRDTRRSRSHDRKRTPEVKEPVKKRSPSPEVDEYTRDQRTVFVSQLAQRLRHAELVEFFSKAGKVKEAKLVMDKKTNRSKGVAYVEYYNEASVNKAVVLTGQKLLGLPVIVQRSEAEKNLLAADQNTVITKKTESVYNRLYIGSLHYNLTEDDLRLVFEPFGEVDYVGIQRDSETGRSKGYGFIQYKRNRDAKVALEKMNGFELAGRPIKVGLVSEKGTTITGGFSLDDNGIPYSIESWCVEVTGVTLTSQSRIELMQKLARDQTLYAKKVAEPVRPNVPAMQSRCIVLNNMFNPQEETAPNWAHLLEEDVKEECLKFGSIVHIKVEHLSPDGEVYLKFDHPHGAEQAVKALNGRWFAARQINASVLPEGLYHARFPKSQHL